MPPTRKNLTQTPLRAELFGHLRIWCDGCQIDLPASKKTRGLLGYLLASPRQRSRSELCDLLWQTAEDPRGALRWSLSKLRTSLGPETIVANRNTVELNRECVDVDVAATNAVSGKVDTSATEKLLAIEASFRGEFLNGLELPDCYSFYEWCQSERSRYGKLRAEILDTLVTRHAEQPAAALEFAHRLVGMNPFEEFTHIRVIELLLALGRPKDAEVQAAQCRKICQLELGVEPSQALDLAFQVAPSAAPNGQTPVYGPLTKPAPSAFGRRSPVRFIGREEECRLIRGALKAPGGAVVLIVGAPGIGKSALLSQIFTAHGSDLLSARAIEVERTRPFGVWMDMFAGLDCSNATSGFQTKLQDLLLALAGSSETLTEQRVFDSVLQLVVQLSDAGPVLISIDDLQWMEPSSCALLSYLIRQLAGAQVHFCLAGRAGEIDDNEAVQMLVSGLGHDVHRIALAGMSETEAKALAQELRPTAEVQDVVTKAQGNPFYLMELSQANHGLIASSSLQEALSGRIERLSRPAATLASWASVFGRIIPVDTLVAASGITLTVALEILEELESHEITGMKGADTIEFTHDLVRDATYERISHTRRRLMHRRVAELLSLEMKQAPGLAAKALHHAAMSDHHILAARAAVIAGQHALRAFANSEAAELTRKGLFHVEKLNVDGEQIGISMALLEVQVLSASGISTRKTPELISALSAQISKASQHIMADEVAQGEYLLSVLFQEIGDLKAAGLATTRAAEAAKRMDAQKQVRQLANTARCLLELGKDLPMATNLSRDADLLAQQEGVADIEVFWSRGLLAYWNGDLIAAAAGLDKALELARNTEDRWRECKCLTWASMVALEQDLTDAAICYATSLRELAARIGEGAMVPLAQAFMAIALRGDDDLVVALDALEDADDKTYLAYVLNLAAEHHRTVGNSDRALEFARKAFEYANAMGNENEKVFAQSIALVLGEVVEKPITITELDEWSSSAQLNERVRRLARIAKEHRRKPTLVKAP